MKSVCFRTIVCKIFPYNEDFQMFKIKKFVINGLNALSTYFYRIFVAENIKRDTVMKKGVLLVMSFWLATLALPAQQPFHKAGEIDLQLGVSAAMGNQRAPVYVFAASPVGLYRITPKLSLGLGTELIATTGIGTIYYQELRFAAPVFLDMKYDFRNMPKDKPVCPFIELRGGFMLPFWMQKDIGYQNIDGYYTTVALGCSAYHSNFSLGLMMYDYSNYHTSYQSRAVEVSLFMRYAYNFRLSDKLVREPQERVKEPEQVEKGAMRLHVYGDIGLFDPIVCMGYHKAPFHLAAGAMLEYRFNRWLSAGVGADVHFSYGFNNGSIIFSYLDFENMSASLPIYGDVRFTIGKRYVRPFFDLRCGYALPLNRVATTKRYMHDPNFLLKGTVRAGGLYFGSAFGLSFGPSELSFGFTDMGLRGQQTNVETGEISGIKTHMVNYHLRYAYKFKIK